MIDRITKERLVVSTVGRGGPYITASLQQLPAVESILKQHGIRYAVDQNAISMNGSPFIATVNLGHSADVNGVQKILDDCEEDAA